MLFQDGNHSWWLVNAFGKVELSSETMDAYRDLVTVMGLPSRAAETYICGLLNGLMSDLWMASPPQTEWTPDDG